MWTRYAPCMVRVKVRTPKPTKIKLVARDKNQANTEFTNTVKTVNGDQDMFIRMPMSPNTLVISITNVAVGERPRSEETTFEVLDVKNEELDVTIGKTNMDTPLVRSFVNFCQKFCYNAGWIPPKDYYSKNNQFKIEYLPQIVGNNGSVLKTPARISTTNGRIQISQEAYIPFTVPMRMAILLHEFSHYYLNSDISDEVEADLNALTIYLGLGYPIKEAYAAFGQTFVGSPTPLNKSRYDIIDTFIKDYIREYNIKDVYADEN